MQIGIFVTFDMRFRIPSTLSVKNCVKCLEQRFKANHIEESRLSAEYIVSTALKAKTVSGAYLQVIYVPRWKKTTKTFTVKQVLAWCKNIFRPLLQKCFNIIFYYLTYIFCFQLHGVDPQTRVQQRPWMKAKEMAKRRLQHEPIQYIIGDWDFRHLTLDMKAPVLIPRPETEACFIFMLDQLNYCQHSVNFFLHKSVC